MKQRKSLISKAAALLILTANISLTACSDEKKQYVFENTEQAVNACQQELSRIRNMKNLPIEKLAAVTQNWITLQDSSFATLVRDTTVKYNSNISEYYFSISDSIREEITRLALEKKRSMSDVVFLKVHTARDRENIQKQKDYKNAVAFYDNLDETPTFKTAEESVNNYDSLLLHRQTFQKEGELLEFIKEEDRCFRSLMEYLSEVNQKDLENITAETSQIFQELYESTQANPDHPVSSRLLIYLSMRFNRRIIQNAEAVVRDIEHHKKLETYQVANYRFMLLQPFISIDSYSMSVITAEQEKKLAEIAEKLPKLLSQLDGKDFDKSKKNDIEKLPEILTEYFLKSYIFQAL